MIQRTRTTAEHIDRIVQPYNDNPDRDHDWRMSDVRNILYLYAGDSNRYTRQEIMQELTGHKLALAKCGITALEKAIEELIKARTAAATFQLR